MTLSDQLLAALVQYGLPLLFGVVMIGAVGAPLPVTLLLIAAGSFVAQGEFDLWWVLGLAIGAAVLGDQIGYMLGRWGGRQLINSMSRWLGGAARIQQAEATARRWGGLGVFLSRWLLTALGPIVNLTSGIAAYPWPAFLLFDLVGEALWVIAYVKLGQVFSDRVQVLTDLLGNLTWAILGFALVLVLGGVLLHRVRSTRQRQAQAVPVPEVAE